ncbi:response regulator [Desulfoluna spongiiphila]|uniref:histidine kinase n=1 Tax=Desulfoluna spongiiphila TaxID=419481 RepID=A0A1G5H2S6_9BACT|nr:response regulator [Desulfoluna spongiiphila]SCY57660.1 two-component system, cell cycle response regulator [Desulfoluna spongiiphila]
MMNHATQQILLVDDLEENLLALKHVLARPHLTILTATSGNEALGLLLDHPVALILMDVQMPEMDGFETAELIRGNPDTCRIPIIFVTAINTDTQHIFKGYDAGAVDYLSKPLDPETLVRKVNVFLELHQYQQSLLATTRELTETVETLKEANSQIQVHQKKKLRDERLKVLLQMAGAMAHELSQPLMALQGNIQLMNIHKESPDKLPVYMERIDESGRRIAGIIRKIQTLHVDDTREYPGEGSIIDLDQTIRILVVGRDGREGSPLIQALNTLDRLDIACVEDTQGAKEALEKNSRDLLFISRPLPDGLAEDLARNLTPPANRPLFVIITDVADELTVSRLIRQGALEVLERPRITPDLIRTLLHRALDTVVSGSTLAAMDRADEASLRDPCTGLYTRHCFENLLHREVKRAHRMGQGLALLLLHLTNFEEVVTTYGTEAGDMVMGSVGSLLADMTRSDDLAARFDNATFAVLLSGITDPEVPRISHRFTDAITQRDFVFNAFRFNLSLTAGIGMLPPGMPGTAEGLIRQAQGSFCETVH